jgi:hypothetical protein
MSDKSLFISSCSRRDLARRRPTRGLAPMQLLVLIVVLLAAFAGVVAGRGGL